MRRRIRRRLGRVTRADNIDFGGLARVSHATDATDWRVEMPFVVVSPDTEDEVCAVVAACIELGLTIIPRGGGTGYTGGAVPLSGHQCSDQHRKTRDTGPGSNCAASKASSTRSPRCVPAPVWSPAASQRRPRRPATCLRSIPTSQDASTIGGNVSMNAGGKKAVLWGTTLDNLVSWRMVTPEAQWLEVERLNHNLGKIHEQAAVSFRITRYAADGAHPLANPSYCELPGAALRKAGTGQGRHRQVPRWPARHPEGRLRRPDHLGGVRAAPHAAFTRTVCLEFFGSDLRRAVPAIVETKDYLDGVMRCCWPAWNISTSVMSGR